jgi:hypothetical protein
MRPIWLLVALLSTGCAALLQHGGGGPLVGYPDGDLPRFAPAALGMAWTLEVRGAGGIKTFTLEGVVDRLGPTPDGGRLDHMAVDVTAGKEHTRLGVEETLYADRVEQRQDDDERPHIELKTPLVPGTRWQAGVGMEKEIVRIEDVCTPAGFFRNALVVRTLTTKHAGPKQTPVTSEALTWHVPDVGAVQARLRGLEPPGPESLMVVTRFVPGTGLPAVTFEACP